MVPWGEYSILTSKWARRKEGKMAEKMMSSKETRQVYRVIREYRHVALVTRADREKAVRFTIPWERLEDVPAKA